MAAGKNMRKPPKVPIAEAHVVLSKDGIYVDRAGRLTSDILEARAFKHMIAATLCANMHNVATGLPYYVDTIEIARVEGP